MSAASKRLNALEKQLSSLDRDDSHSKKANDSATMDKLEQTLAQGVKDDKIPHAVVYATNADGQSFPPLPCSILAILSY